MTRFVVGDDRGQSTLFPERLDDYLGNDNPVRAIDVLVDELDLAEFGFDGVEPEATGTPAYHPTTLWKIYVYGYLNRVQSSRRLVPSKGYPEFAACGDGPDRQRPDQFNPDWIHLQVTRDTDGPGQAACREPLTERRAETVTSIRPTQPKRIPAAITRSISAKAISGLVRAVLDWNARTLQTNRVARPTLENEET